MKNFDLLEELKKYKPFNEQEKKYVQETIDFLEHGNDQFVRTNFEKHIVAGAYLFNSTLDKILLTHHKTLGIWLHFGGHSDGEANSLNVALREVREESGIENINIGDGHIADVDIHTIPENKKKNEPAHKHIDIRFIFTTPEENYKISDESDDLAWIPFEKFKKMLIEGKCCPSGPDRTLYKLTEFVENHKKMANTHDKTK